MQNMARNLCCRCSGQLWQDFKQRKGRVWFTFLRKQKLCEDWSRAEHSRAGRAFLETIPLVWKKEDVNLNLNKKFKFPWKSPGKFRVYTVVPPYPWSQLPVVNCGPKILNEKSRNKCFKKLYHILL